LTTTLFNVRKLGLFARVLVDVDLFVDLPLELVVKRRNGESFVQGVAYEKLPNLCSHCGNVDHHVTDCRFVKLATSKAMLLSLMLMVEVARVDVFPNKAGKE
jgi:hypothetical protein